MRRKLCLMGTVIMLCCTFPGTVFAAGWVKSEGGWQYQTGNGAAAVSWQKIGGEWYYFDGSGYMCTGWQSIDGHWYFFHESGAMAHGSWVGDYYVGADGAMLTNTVTPDGYRVGSDGKWTGTSAQVSAPSKAITDQYSGIMMQFGYWDSALNYKKPQASKKDGYYEITNVEMYVYDTLDKGYVEGLKKGSKIVRGEDTYVLNRIETFYGKKWYTFINVNSSAGMDMYWTLVEGDDCYYQRHIGEVYVTKTIYRGTIYMSENCKILEYLEYPNSVQRKSVKQFIDDGFESKEHMGGQGEIKTDSNGIITEYQEFYVS